MGREKENRELYPPGKFPVSGLNREHLAAAFGVSTRTIAKWLVKGLPRKDDGFSLPECINWFATLEDGRLKKDQSQEPGSPDKSPWLEAYRKERARMARLDRKARQGELLPRGEVEKAFTDRCYEFARELLHVSRRVAHKLAEKSEKTIQECSRVIDAEHRRMMEEYSRPIEVKEKREK